MPFFFCCLLKVLHQACTEPLHLGEVFHLINNRGRQRLCCGGRVLVRDSFDLRRGGLWEMPEGSLFISLHLRLVRDERWGLEGGVAPFEPVAHHMPRTPFYEVACGERREMVVSHLIIRDHEHAAVASRPHEPRIQPVPIIIAAFWSQKQAVCPFELFNHSLEVVLRQLSHFLRVQVPFVQHHEHALPFPSPVTPDLVDLGVVQNVIAISGPPLEITHVRPVDHHIKRP